MNGHKFKPGDRVTLINDYGAEFPNKTVVTTESTSYGPAYKINPTDTPWFAVPERNLVPAPLADQDRIE